MNNKCVYIWVNETTNQPFYVGCGTHKRATCADGRTKLFNEIYNSNKCHYIIIKDNLSEIEAAELERKVIKDYREQGCELVNQTNGGEMRQYSLWTEEMRREYSERLIGANNPNFNNHWTEEMKTHLSKVRKEKEVAKGGRNPRATPVMCVETGVIYACKRDAGKAIGVADGTSSISFCMRNPKRVAGKGKYHFVAKEMFAELNTEEKRIEWLEKIKKS